MTELSEERLAELAEGGPPDGGLAGLLAARADLAAELEAARRTRALLAALAAAGVEPADDFAARLMQRIRADETAALVIDLSLAGFGRALLELLAALFDLLPPMEAAPPAPASGGAA